MPMYDCTVFAHAKDDFYTVATFRFEHEQANDPNAALHFSLGSDGVSRLWEPAARDRLAMKISRGAWAYVTRRGGTVDLDVVYGVLSEGLAVIAPEANQEVSGN